MHCLLLAGRADEAVELADRALADVGSVHSRSMPGVRPLVGWRPIGVRRPRRGRSASTRARASATAFVARGVPRRDRRQPRELVVPCSEGSPACARDAAVVVNARAARAVVEHADDRAAALFADLHRRHPDDPVVDRHLRRFLALGYVLDPVSRARWDAADLGPAHERTRAVARLLLDLRAGRRRDEPQLDPPHAFTVLPLPWSVELACRLDGRHPRVATALLDTLIEHAGARAHAELRWAATSTERAVAGGAAGLLARTPREPDDVTAVGVLGPLQLHRGGIEVRGGELRRQRVRELLTMLVVERTSAAIAPPRSSGRSSTPRPPAATCASRSPTCGACSSRIAHPASPATTCASTPRRSASSPSPKLVVDVWELDRQAQEAAAAERAGDVDAAIALLGAATAAWRGDPLTELDRLGDYESAIERVRILQRSCLLRLGELRLTVGDAAGALDAGDRALRHDPYHEAAHRLALAAAIQRGERATVHLVLGRIERALDELGVSPEPATVMLMRSATRHRAVTMLAS